jgi:hypothetical protein
MFGVLLIGGGCTFGNANLEFEEIFMTRTQRHNLSAGSAGAAGGVGWCTGSANRGELMQ